MIPDVHLSHSPQHSGLDAAPMHAAQLVAPGQFAVVEAPMPQPGPTQVRVRLQGCGVCASSLPVFQGREWFQYPTEAGSPGHEGWGVIDAIGEGIAERFPHLVPGVRVGLLSSHAFATHDVAEANKVLPLPAALDGRPFPAEALGCAINIFLRAGVQEGQQVAIVGMGFLGGLLTQLSRAAGAEVIAISRRPYSLEVGAECGAQHRIVLDDHWRVISQVRSLTNGRFCPVVIECTGLEWPLNLSAELTAERGRLVIAGFHQDGMRSVNMQLWNWRGLDVINAHEREDDRYIDGMRLATAATATGLLSPERLYTHHLPLSQIQQAFELLQNRPDGFVKALIHFNDYA